MSVDNMRKLVKYLIATIFLFVTVPLGLYWTVAMLISLISLDKQEVLSDIKYYWKHIFFSLFYWASK